VAPRHRFYDTTRRDVVGWVVEHDQEYRRHDAIRVHVDLKMNAPWTVRE
jgi:hypothetical protein